MSYIQALVLGIVQGLTEFLPISSSGHLIVIPSILGWAPSGLVFDTTLHLGTAAALLVYFFKDLKNIVFGFLKDVWQHQDDFNYYSEYGKYGMYILLGSVPAGLIGFLFEDKIEYVFRALRYVAIFLFLGSLLMYVSEKLSFWKLSSNVNYFKSLAIGLFQSLALLPGFSRSGSTIAGGMLFGLSREEAARFSFLLSVPIVVLAGGYELARAGFLITLDWLPILLVGFFASFLTGLAAIRFLLNFLNKKGLSVFIIYRLVLIAAILLFVKM
uniref:Undecaprenyl-diphosphatase n=1 Tax=candidate division WWE3 bacterium TaxID=2053526 RepID=A0A7C4TPJ6_UNCKA